VFRASRIVMDAQHTEECDFDLPGEFRTS